MNECFGAISFRNQQSQIGTWMKTHTQVSRLILFYLVVIFGSVAVVSVFLNVSHILGTMT
jgi:hypothetical protein